VVIEILVLTGLPLTMHSSSLWLNRVVASRQPQHSFSPRYAGSKPSGVRNVICNLDKQSNSLRFLRLKSCKDTGVDENLFFLMKVFYCYLNGINCIMDICGLFVNVIYDKLASQGE
jgi:hypothetical protein